MIIFQPPSVVLIEHDFMTEEGFPPVPIPVHSNQDLKKGTEQKALKDLGMK